MKKIIISLIVLLSFSILFGCTTTEQNDTNELETLTKNFDLKINEKNETINELNSKIIELQESNEYLRTEKIVAQEKQSELQEVYNMVWSDLTKCYWANVCSYNPDYCVEHFKDSLTGWTGQEIYTYYSDECDESDRDWDKYNEFDTAVE